MKKHAKLREPSDIPINGQITAHIVGAVIDQDAPFLLEESLVVGMIEPEKKDKYDKLWGCWRCGRKLFEPGTSLNVVRHPERPDCVLFECDGDHEWSCEHCKRPTPDASYKWEPWIMWVSGLFTGMGATATIVGWLY